MTRIDRSTFSTDPLMKPTKKAKRLYFAIAFLCACLSTCLVASSATAEPGPWLQIVPQSRPTNLWTPGDFEEEITTKSAEYPGFGEGVAQVLRVQGEPVGCLGTDNVVGNGFCGLVTGGPAISTAAQLEVLLESLYGLSEVEVEGGPVGSAPLKITVPGLSVPPVVARHEDGLLGAVTAEVISDGGSGHLFVSILNLGDAALDGTSTPVRIVDELPAGVKASGVEGFAGLDNKDGPVECELESDNLVACTFENVLASYEAIEVEILVSVATPPPPDQTPGTVTVSGGNAPITTASQNVRVSTEKAPFGFEHFFARPEREGGASAIQAGEHPFQLTTTIVPNSNGLSGITHGEARVEQAALPRNLRFPLPAGLVGNASAMPQCPMSDFLEGARAIKLLRCAPESALGVASVNIFEPFFVGPKQFRAPVFNLPPAEGEPARFGFIVERTPVLVDTRVDETDGYRIIAEVRNVSTIAQFLSSTLVLWGAPGDSRHDATRGAACIFEGQFGGSLGPCERPPGLGDPAFLRMPVSCDGPLGFEAEAEPWNVPLGSEIARASFSAPGLSGCNRVPFAPSVAAEPTSHLAGSASGLNFELTMPNANLLNPEGIAEGQPKRVQVTLPAGVTVNPSEAEGLAGCSSAQYAAETAGSAPGAGCPEASKIGTVQIQTPLLDETATGAVYVGAPYDNPFDSLLSLYVIAKIPARGIIVKQAGKIEADPATGQLTTTFDNLPQIPFDTFKLQFKDGPRAPLVMPAACGSYDMTARFTPWNAANPDDPAPDEVVTRTVPLSVNQGPHGGPCPSGPRPFKPGFSAGTLSNAAGHYSQLNVRLTREDDEQEFTNFSVKLPRGVIGKLAGVPFCPDAAIAAARARTGTNGGQEELDHPSCPSNSQIGRLLVGAGVGGSLTYVPGKLYLAGTYNGAKLSVVAITPARVGPFDLGSVVIREALKVDPETAEVSVDAVKSDPIPHILQGIPVRARDIRVYVDRPEFILNPTSCKRMVSWATVTGAGLDTGSAADDSSVKVDAPFQAASCASLGFKPKLSLRLFNGKRRAFPRLRAVVKARPGDANIGRAQVTLPHTTFLEQGHIRTICTRVQFAAGAGNGQRCPKGSIYGRAKAFSPLLDEPLKGPVFLRSSNHALPDLVAALHSKKVDINLAGRIDSAEGGHIRNTFETVPDAPVSKFVLEMQGGRKGLIVNSVNLCHGKSRAKASFTGQNGSQLNSRPVVRAKCGGSKETGRHGR
jgi:hypothetical protein